MGILLLIKLKKSFNFKLDFSAKSRRIFLIIGIKVKRIFLSLIIFISFLFGKIQPNTQILFPFIGFELSGGILGTRNTSEGFLQYSVLGGLIVKPKHQDNVYKLTAIYSSFNKNKIKSYNFLIDKLFINVSTIQTFLGLGFGLETMDLHEDALSYSLSARAGFDYYFSKNVFTDFVVNMGLSTPIPSFSNANYDLLGNLACGVSLNYKF